MELEKQLKFLQHIATTTFRPDVVLASDVTKHAVLLEEAFERKLPKYERSGEGMSARWLERKMLANRG